MGLAKEELAHIVQMQSHRLRVQQCLTEEIAASISDIIKPKGVGVVIEAR